MYFSRLTLTDTSLLYKLRGNSYSEHQVLWTVFEDDRDAQRDFLYHKINGPRPQYYMLSSRKPKASMPEWQLEGPKAYTPAIQNGQKFYFTLRANPTVTLSKPTNSAKKNSKKRIDVVTYEKIKIQYKTLPHNKKPSYYELVQTSCLNWLEKRAQKNGFVFDRGRVQAEAYTKHLARKQNKNITYYTVDFSGVLQVTEVESFKRVLFQGLGRGRAFGCGMLLIKRGL